MKEAGAQERKGIQEMEGLLMALQFPVPLFPKPALLPLLGFWEGPQYYKILLFHLNYFELDFSLLLNVPNSGSISTIVSFSCILSIGHSI